MFLLTNYMKKISIRSFQDCGSDRIGDSLGGDRIGFRDFGSLTPLLTRLMPGNFQAPGKIPRSLKLAWLLYTSSKASA